MDANLLFRKPSVPYTHQSLPDHEYQEPTGQFLTAANCPGADGGDTQYCGLIGVWKDTLFVKQGYSIVVRTRYSDFVGDFVIHCHILDHEDQGMMQNVRIVP